MTGQEDASRTPWSVEGVARFIAHELGEKGATVEWASRKPQEVRVEALGRRYRISVSELNTVMSEEPHSGIAEDRAGNWWRRNPVAGGWLHEDNAWDQRQPGAEWGWLVETWGPMRPVDDPDAR